MNCTRTHARTHADTNMGIEICMNIWSDIARVLVVVAIRRAIGGCLVGGTEPHRRAMRAIGVNDRANALHRMLSIRVDQPHTSHTHQQKTNKARQHLRCILYILLARVKPLPLPPRQLVPQRSDRFIKIHCCRKLGVEHRHHRPHSHRKQTHSHTHIHIHWTHRFHAEWPRKLQCSIRLQSAVNGHVCVYHMCTRARARLDVAQRAVPFLN